MGLPDGWSCHIKEYRVKLPRERSTQEYLADQLGLSRAMLSRYETGQSIPDAVMAVRLAKLLGVSVEELYSCG